MVALSKTKIADFAILVWFLFTTSMVIWWLIFALETLSEFQTYVENSSILSPGQASAKHLFEKRHRMLLWEGSILVALIAGGGGTLMYMLHRDRKKNRQVKTFFANFSHDLKTSIARLRLDSQILAEKIQGPAPALERLRADHARLETQLENSLYVANQEHVKFAIEKLRLSDLFKSIRQNFDEMSFSLKNDIEISADRRAIESVFRNLIQNALIHGQASTFYVEGRQLSANTVILTCRDDGSGLAASEIAKLGHKIVFSDHPQSNGIGLFIVRQLIEAMGGRITFAAEPGEASSRLKVDLQLPGQVLS